LIAVLFFTTYHSDPGKEINYPTEERTFQKSISLRRRKSKFKWV